MTLVHDTEASSFLIVAVLAELVWASVIAVIDPFDSTSSQKSLTLLLTVAPSFIQFLTDTKHL